MMLRTLVLTLLVSATVLLSTLSCGVDARSTKPTKKKSVATAPPTAEQPMSSSLKPTVWRHQVDLLLRFVDFVFAMDAPFDIEEPLQPSDSSSNESEPNDHWIRQQSLRYLPTFGFQYNASCNLPFEDRGMSPLKMNTQSKVTRAARMGAVNCSEAETGGPHPEVRNQWFRFVQTILHSLPTQHRLNVTAHEETAESIMNTLCSSNDLPTFLSCSATPETSSSIGSSIATIRYHQYFINGTTAAGGVHSRRNKKIRSHTFAALLWRASTLQGLRVIDLSDNHVEAAMVLESSSAAAVDVLPPAPGGKLPSFSLGPLCEASSATLRILALSRNRIRLSKGYRKSDSGWSVECPELTHLILDDNQLDVRRLLQSFKWDGTQAAGGFSKLQYAMLHNNLRLGGEKADGRDFTTANSHTLRRLLSIPSIMHVRLDRQEHHISSLEALEIVEAACSAKPSVASLKESTRPNTDPSAGGVEWRQLLAVELFDPSSPATTSDKPINALTHRVNAACAKTVVSIKLAPRISLAPKFRRLKREFEGKSFLMNLINARGSGYEPLPPQNFFVVGDFGTGGHYGQGVKEVETAAAMNLYAQEQKQENDDVMLTTSSGGASSSVGSSKGLLMHDITRTAVISVGDNFYYDYHERPTPRVKYTRHTFELLFGRDPKSKQRGAQQVGQRATKEEPSNLKEARSILAHLDALQGEDTASYNRYALWENVKVFAGWGNHDDERQTPDMQLIDGDRWVQPDRFFDSFVGSTQKTAGVAALYFSNTVPSADGMGFAKGWMESTVQLLGANRQRLWKELDDIELSVNSIRNNASLNDDEKARARRPLIVAFLKKVSTIPFTLFISHYPLISTCRSVEGGSHALIQALLKAEAAASSTATASSSLVQLLLSGHDHLSQHSINTNKSKGHKTTTAFDHHLIVGSFARLSGCYEAQEAHRVEYEPPHKDVTAGSYPRAGVAWTEPTDGMFGHGALTSYGVHMVFRTQYGGIAHHVFSPHPMAERTLAFVKVILGDKNSQQSRGSRSDASTERSAKENLRADSSADPNAVWMGSFNVLVALSLTVLVGVWRMLVKRRRRVHHHHHDDHAVQL